MNPRRNITKSSMVSGITFVSGPGRNVTSWLITHNDIGTGARNTPSPVPKFPEENVDVDNWDNNV